MAGIDPYIESIGVQPNQAEMPQLGPISDGPGGAISQLGDVMSGIGERFMKVKAEQDAKAAAGGAQIIKGEDGNYRYPDPPKGGLYYMQVYRDVMDQRYAATVVSDFQNTLDENKDAYRNDPQGFLAYAGGMAKGVLDGAPDFLRGNIDVALSREIVERHRGLADTKARNDFENAVDGEQESIKGLAAQATRAYRMGAGGVAIGDSFVQQIKQHYDNLTSLGAMSPVGVHGRVQQLNASLGDDRDFAGSMDTLKTVAPILSEDNSSLEDLGRLHLMLSGVDPGGEVAGMTFDQWNQALPSQTVRNAFDSEVLREQTGRISAANEARRQAEAAAQLQATKDAATASYKAVEAIDKGFKELNANPGIGLSREQAAAIKPAFGNIFENMSSDKGRMQILGVINKTGYVPDELIQYLDTQLDGDALPELAGFVKTLASMNVKGANIGQQAVERLSAANQAALKFLDVQTEMGRGAEAAKLIIEQRRRGNQPSLADAQAATTQVGKDGKTIGYNQLRVKAISASSGVPEAQVRSASHILQRFDALYPYVLQLQNGDTVRALEVTGQMLKTGWVRNDTNHFLGGFMPRAFARQNLTLRELDSQLAPVLGTEKNPSRAHVYELTRDRKPRVRFEPIDGGATRDPVTGQELAGRYMVTFYDYEGNLTGSTRYDADIGYQNVLRHRAAKPKPKVQAPTGGPTFRLQRDPKTGKVAYRPAK